jgi:F0F1-type ATP synthase assembly protein I
VPLQNDLQNDLESRTAKARGVHRQTQAEAAGRTERDGKAAKGLGVGLAIAYALIGLPLVGAGVGYLLSRALGGPWVAIGAVGGFVGGIGFALFVNGRESSRL